MLVKRECKFLHDGIVLLILITVFPVTSRAELPKWSVATLVRQTVSNELVSVNEAAHHRYRVDESSSNGFRNPVKHSSISPASYHRDAGV